MTNSGTSCSYEDPHLFCIQRECKRVGCDHRIGSVKSYNNCGICGGSESDCDFVRLPKRKVARFRNSKFNLQLVNKNKTEKILNEKFRNA